MEIILVRHGETEWNRSQVFRGRADVPLNDAGLRQAALLGDYLGAEKIGAVYSSPLQRAVKTAEAVASHHGLGVKISDGLIDIDFGDWQGMSSEAVKEGYPDLYSDWIEHPERMTLPAGESLQDVAGRSLEIVKSVLGEQGSDKVVLVSHRVVIKVLFTSLLGLAESYFRNIRLDTGGVTRFIYEEGRFVLSGHNDTSFLRPMGGLALPDF